MKILQQQTDYVTNLFDQMGKENKNQTSMQQSLKDLDNMLDKIHTNNEVSLNCLRMLNKSKEKFT